MDKKKTIEEDLLGKSSVKRRKAAVSLRKSNDKSFSNLLYRALKMELDSKRYQTKVELIQTIGFLQCFEATELLEHIIFNEDLEHDMVTRVAAEAWVRIKREDTTDATPTITILTSCNYSAKEGALNALGYDKMVPSEHQQKVIIDLCENFGGTRPTGYMDPRYGLTAACAAWKSGRVKGFLELCLNSNDSPLIYVASNALKGKYVKLR